MELYKKICKNLSCGKEFMGTKSQLYCCIDCRPTKCTPKPKHKRVCSLSDVARRAKELGVSYGKYVAMQYNLERKKIK